MENKITKTEDSILKLERHLNNRTFASEFMAYAFTYHRNINDVKKC